MNANEGQKMTKVTINREELLSQLDVISPGLAPRDIVEQSSCVVFKGGRIMTFNDELACQMSTNLPLEGAIHAGTLLETLRKMKQDVLEVEIKDNEIVIEAKRTKVGIAREANILLPIDTVDSPSDWSPLPDVFGDAVEMVLPCCGKDEHKFALTCVHLTSKGIDGTDNFQYARYKMKLPIETEVLIRAATMKHVVPMGMNEVSLSESWIHFRNSRGLVMSCRRWTEEWKDYSSVTGIEGSDIHLPRSIGSAAELANIFSSQNADNNQIEISLLPRKLKLSARGTSGWVRKLIKVNYNGPEMTFRIDAILLKKITQTHSACVISEKCLKVSTGKFTYVTVLGENESGGQAAEE